MPVLFPHARAFPAKAAPWLLLALWVSGCASLKPQPVSPPELQAVTTADRARAVEGVPPLEGPLTLEEAMARAIKYNLERRTRAMEEALALGQLDAGNFDLLPKLVASAGYRDRNNDLVSRSQDSVTGQPSLANPYISSARSATTTDLTLTWSLLDFGQSYYASKQNADRALIAAERRRKALHILVQDVRTAFWRAASAQQLHDDVTATRQMAQDALDTASRAQATHLRNPLDMLRYQRQLMDNVRLLESIQQELATARIELAALCNLPFTEPLVVVEPAQPRNTAWLDVPVEQLEAQAIAHNADLRESIYNARIASAETRRTLLKLFPGLSFSYGVKSSNDPYLIHQHWNDAGAQVSFNLLGLLAAPAQMRLAEAGVALADQRRMAMQMAVLAQLHIARMQYANALQQLDRAEALWQVDRDIAFHVTKREEAEVQTKLDRIAAQTAALLSRVRRCQALAQLQSAASKLQASLGQEPNVPDGPQVTLAQLQQALAQAPLQAPAPIETNTTTAAAPTRN